MQTVSTRLFQALLAYWRNATRAQQALFIAGTLLLGSMVFHGVALVASGGSIHGPVSFRKAMTFAETLGLTCWVIGWMLPLFAFGRRTTWLVTGFVLLFTLGEAFLMSMQVWRGVPSHYNFTTPFNMAVFYATGVGAVGFTVLAAALLVLSFRRHNAPPSVMLAIRTGLMITLFGSATGVLMSVNAGPIWEGIAAIMQRFSTSPIGRYIGQPEGTVGGNIVLLHALGVHGLQLLPLVGWLLGYSQLAERQRVCLVAATALSWAALLALLTVQAFRGLPLTSIAPLTGALLALAAAATLICYLIAGRAALQGMPGASPTSAVPQAV